MVARGSDLLPPPEENCRVCTDFQSWTRKKKRKEAAAPQTPPPHTKQSSAATVGSAAGLAGAALSSSTTQPSSECPPDSQVLGRSTWTFLHSMAAYYPKQPDPQDQKDMRTLLNKFARFYPCGYCASHLRAEMDIDPPRVESRHELSQWMCETHNKVNDMLGKPVFDCAKVDERWRDGPADGSCD
ncbi:ERV/ALR sulfhydryl oxidase domain-containing protein [Dimargaris cristalligena]|uniref:Sulfhydryl oxidase n=1 Tax=Dimargaris cristalligena TaxID=215637 RepID=A0A4P9ZW17_9FUNG|nr:ERV/ALR sulfhydryl oxidase domain-containing protein [Dimargaris cristalligena]|eukprot:RKP37793.1 ERV/ALR sulfhydryl oxidase domain-containing protein [Dimargaris cristalligena]